MHRIIALTDPAPRNYIAAVTPLRRLRGGETGAPSRTTAGEIEAWLYADAVREDDLLVLFDALAWRMVAAGLCLDRATLHVGTLHPQIVGFGWHWNRADGFCDEVKVAEEVRTTDAYRRSPLFRAVEHGETCRGAPSDPRTRERFPLMAELAAQDITDYTALPLRAGGGYHNAATIATRHPGGFPPAQYEIIRRILRLFALHVERHISLRIARNLLDVYLGSAAGSRVLQGSIRRGAGEVISAIVWISDLRGSTDLADRLQGSELLALLNAYFERLVVAVLGQGGEILKFVGDGLLAVFPYSAFASAGAAAEAALTAAVQARDAVETLNREPPAELDAIAGWKPLVTGIALHEGDVFFGNVGAAERLDFTVIGPAVNTASRIEALTRDLGRAILITEPVAERLNYALEDLGWHHLRGLARPIRVFSPGVAAAQD